MAYDNWSPIARTYDALKAGSIDGTDEEPHDRAIARALCAKYKVNKSVKGNPECTIFIGKLNHVTTEDTLTKLFSKYGDINRTRLVRDAVTGFSKCYAFIEYDDEKSAYRAQRDGNKITVDDKEIFVDFECERVLKGWIPRRLGGGLGGKKESGQLRYGGKDRPFRKPINIADRALGFSGSNEWGRSRFHDYGDSESSSHGRSPVRNRSRDRDSGRERKTDRYRSDHRDSSRRHKHRSRSREKSRHDDK